MLEVFVVKIDAILERQKDIRTTAFKTTRGIKSSNCNSIIRIYGRNKRRESIQVLVHNYCPYFYLLVPLDDESKIDEQFCNVTFRHALTSILLNDIRISNWRLSVMQNKPLNDVVIRRAKNCYGYHSESSVFLEIKLNDWHLIRPLANYFHHKKVCGIKFQPCESHIDYDLKFMIDHNLSGMDWMVLKKARLLMVNEEKKIEDLKFIHNQTQLSTTCDLQYQAEVKDIIVDANYNYLDSLMEEMREECSQMEGAELERLTPSSQLAGSLPKTDSQLACEDAFEDLLDRLERFGFNSANSLEENDMCTIDKVNNDNCKVSDDDDDDDLTRALLEFYNCEK